MAQGVPLRVTGWRVRAFSDADYAAYARIASIAEGRRIDAAEARALDARASAGGVRLVVPDEEDAPVGYGEIRTGTDPLQRRYRLRLGVDPARRGRGAGAALWDALRRELADRSADAVDLWAADHTACQAFITKRGFVEVTRAYQQVRAVTSAPLPTRALAERIAATGIRITTLAALRDAIGDAALEAAWALHTELLADVATLGHATAGPLEGWIAEHTADATALPQAHFIALDGARFVGAVAARREGDDGLRIGLTGVVPDHRRRGIGRLLTLRLHAWARANGLSEIHTLVARGNTAMLALNDALGYPIVGSLGGYELRL